MELTGDDAKYFFVSKIVFAEAVGTSTSAVESGQRYSPYPVGLVEELEQLTRKRDDPPPKETVDEEQARLARIELIVAELRQKHPAPKRDDIVAGAKLVRTVALSRLHRAAENTSRDAAIFIKRDGARLKSIRTAFATACGNAELGTDVTPHTLRHTFASRLVMEGVDLRTVQQLGGWKQLSMVLRYSHLSKKHEAEAVERIVGKTEKKSLRYSLHANRQSS